MMGWSWLHSDSPMLAWPLLRCQSMVGSLLGRPFEFDVGYHGLHCAGQRGGGRHPVGRCGMEHCRIQARWKAYQKLGPWGLFATQLPHTKPSLRI